MLSNRAAQPETVEQAYVVEQILERRVRTPIGELGELGVEPRV
ncbi:hypothetical protein [Streptomyces jumonjinensis]